jgi:hypothetical protein
MRRIHYANTSVVTGDRTAKALLRYARALAVADRSDVVEIPVLTDAGDTARAHLLIGPASEIVSTPQSDGPDACEDDEVIAYFERETLRLQPARPAWSDEMTEVPGLSGWSDLQES